MNFEIYENYIETLYDEEVRNMAGMNPYNLAPWNIGWHPRHVDRFYMHRMAINRGYHFPISKRNQRNIFRTPEWLPMSIQRENRRRYLAALDERRQGYSQKTQFLKRLMDKYDDKYEKAQGDGDEIIRLTNQFMMEYRLYGIAENLFD